MRLGASSITVDTELCIEIRRRCLLYKLLGNNFDIDCRLELSFHMVLTRAPYPPRSSTSVPVAAVVEEVVAVGCRRHHNHPWRPRPQSQCSMQTRRGTRATPQCHQDWDRRRNASRPSARRHPAFDRITSPSSLTTPVPIATNDPMS